MSKILIISAHPDDEVYGMGGTIAKLVDEKNEVHLLIVTDGSTSQYKDHPDLKQILNNKKEETKTSSDILGISSVIYGNLPDMKLDSIPHTQINKVIEDVICDLQPEIVFTHFYGDVNLDHQRIYESTLVATRPTSQQCVKELYCYSVPSSTEWSPQLFNNVFTPNTYVDITDYSQKKYLAINAYKTELRNFPHPRSVDYVKKCDEVVGLQMGLKLAESFILLRKIK